MSRLTVALLLICLHGSVYGSMECSFPGRESNFVEKILNTCPSPLGSPDKSYCCYNLSEETFYCCTIMEFAQNGLGIVIPVIIAAVIVIGLIVCCISCLCCSCCPWYRRRQGTVYGKVQAPIVQVIQPQSNIPPSYTNQSVSYPTDSTTGMPQPPPYNEAYAKQAPYNPAYPPSQ